MPTKNITWEAISRMPECPYKTHYALLPPQERDLGTLLFYLVRKSCSREVRRTINAVTCCEAQCLRYQFFLYHPNQVGKTARIPGSLRYPVLPRYHMRHRNFSNISLAANFVPFPRPKLCCKLNNLL